MCIMFFFMIICNALLEKRRAKRIICLTNTQQVRGQIIKQKHKSQMCIMLYIQIWTLHTTRLFKKFSFTILKLIIFYSFLLAEIKPCQTKGSPPNFLIIHVPYHLKIKFFITYMCYIKNIYIYIYNFD